MRFALGNDVFNVFNSQMAPERRQGEKKDIKKTAKITDEKLNFAELLSKEYSRIATGSI